MKSIDRSLAMIAAALLVATPAFAQMAPAAKPTPKAAPAKAAPAKSTPAKSTPAKPAGPRGPRTAQSLACSKQADGKNLHGPARTSFMRTCNKS